MPSRRKPSRIAGTTARRDKPAWRSSHLRRRAALRIARPWRSAFPRTFITALNALRRNKMRSALSALGVIIAVAAVIAMMEIGHGSKAAMQKTIASMGADTLRCNRGRPPAAASALEREAS